MVKDGESKNAFAFFAIGVEGANMDTLSKLSVRSPIKLKGAYVPRIFPLAVLFHEMVSSKNPGTPVQLLPPSGWADL